MIASLDLQKYANMQDYFYLLFEAGGNLKRFHFNFRHFYANLRHFMRSFVVKFSLCQFFQVLMITLFACLCFMWVFKMMNQR